jgi:hypothetical protein
MEAMTPAEFRARWETDNDPVIVFLPSSLEGILIPDDAMRFLLEGGLPKDAAPFLSFNSPTNGPLPTAAQKWHLQTGFSRFRVIGSNGSGDPICLDEADKGSVVYLNHDKGFARVFINQSVCQLAESLLTYRHFVSLTNERGGEDAFLEGNIPPDLHLWVERELRRIDPQALQPDSFWKNELEALQSLKATEQ